MTENQTDAAAVRRTKGSFEPDTPYRLRQLVGPWITKLAAAIGQPEYRIRPTEYVGTVCLPIDELVATLRAEGFTWGPFSWYHRPPVGTSPNGSWTYRSSLRSDRQLHVILSARAPERVEVYAHEEFNWLRHPIKHGRAEGIRREDGAREMRRWLDAMGVEFDRESRVRRKGARLLDTWGTRLRDSTPDTPW